MSKADLSPVNLLNFDHEHLKTYLATIGEKPYRATQLLRWIHQQYVTDFAEMTNISLALRDKFAQEACMTLPAIIQEHTSWDGTHKFILQLHDGQRVETVFIPEGKRGTLCVSSQVGCALDCSFCSTGKQGFNRNLTTAEIIAQVWIANHALKDKYSERNAPVTNVVMMGMGEPLLNYPAVLQAMSLMLDDNAYGLSKYRVTLSTSGVLPAMKRLKEDSPVALAVSLHAPDNALRDVLVPVNKKYPLEALLAFCRDYYEDQPKRAITIEYVMIDGVNDQPQQAKALVKRLEGLRCKINLIPFNPFPGTTYRRSSEEAVDTFRHILQKAGFNTFIRKTRGDEITAACGQLVGDVTDRTLRTPCGREYHAERKRTAEGSE